MSETTESKLISQLRVPELKAELERRGLNSKGNKQLLTDTLIKALVSENEDPSTFLIAVAASEVSTASPRKTSPRKAVDEKKITPAETETVDDSKDMEDHVDDVVAAAEGDETEHVETAAANVSVEKDVEEEEEDVEHVEMEEEKGGEEDHEVEEEEMEENIESDLVIQEEDDVEMDEEQMNEEKTTKEEEIHEAMTETPEVPEEHQETVEVENQEETMENHTKDEDEEEQEEEEEMLEDPLNEPHVDESDKLAGSTSNGATGSASSHTTTDGSATSTTASTATAKPDVVDDINPRSLWVRGLTSATSAAMLKELCLKYGRVQRAKIFTTKGKRTESTCFGFVTFADRNAAEECQKALNGIVYMEKTIKVEMADKSTLAAPGSAKAAAPTPPAPAPKKEESKKSTSSSSDKKAEERKRDDKEAEREKARRNRKPITYKSSPSSSRKDKEKEKDSRSTIRRVGRDSAASQRRIIAPASSSLRVRVPAGSSSRVVTHGSRPGIPSLINARVSRPAAESRGSRHSSDRMSISTASLRRPRAPSPGPTRRDVGRDRAQSSRSGDLSRGELADMLRRKDEEHRQREQELQLERERERIKFEKERLERERLELELQKQRLALEKAAVRSSGSGTIVSSDRDMGRSERNVAVPSRSSRFESGYDSHLSRRGNTSSTTQMRVPSPVPVSSRRRDDDLSSRSKNYPDRSRSTQRGGARAGASGGHEASHRRVGAAGGRDVGRERERSRTHLPNQQKSFAVPSSGRGSDNRFSTSAANSVSMGRAGKGDYRADSYRDDVGAGQSDAYGDVGGYSASASSRGYSTGRPDYQGSARSQGANSVLLANPGWPSVGTYGGNNSALGSWGTLSGSNAATLVDAAMAVAGQQNWAGASRGADWTSFNSFADKSSRGGARAFDYRGNY